MTDATDLRDRYRRAEAFCEWNVRGVVRNVSIRPEWIDDGRSLRWWRHRADGTRQLVQVETSTGARRVVDDAPSPGASVPEGHLRSPDGRLDLLVVEGDLWIERVADGDRFRLTADATDLHDYASSPQSSTTWLSALRSGAVSPPIAVWSPDSSRILTHRLDQRAVPELSLLEMRPADGHRPRHWTYRMPFMGDELATAQLVVIDVDDPARPVVHEVAEPLLVEFVSPLELGWVWWGADAQQVWFLREARGASSLTLCRAELDGGAVHRVLTESADDYVEPHPLLPWPATVSVVRGGSVVVWPSERDGWRHLYAVDVSSGQVTRQLTAGDWSVREVVHADDDWVWFTGCGREPGRDPYFRHLYRVPLDGGAAELLTPEDADHAVDVAPDGSCLVDTASTIDTAPVARLRRSDGELIAELERADLSGLEALGWRPPERFRVPAADGTDLYGVLYLPSDFDPERSYPVLDSWYPGPQLIRTPTSFTVDDDAGVDAWPGPWGAQAIAELGVVVVNVDGRGTPLRCRDFHHATYGRLQDHAIEDHLAAVDALAATRPWMDVGRLGAQGHSAGAAATVRALLARPDRYRMGIAGSAVNDLRRYIAYWGEKYQGLLGTFDEDAQSNLSLADRLEGYLLMLHGELDDNVHPSNTLAMYDAFVRADKDVDLVILAGESHPCWRHPYYVRRSWDAVCRHLIGVEPPSGYRVAPPPDHADGPGW
jgi:dipeptidyl aminopeptidase/acylaminoacyl peptidase